MSLHLGVWQKNADAAAKYYEDLTTERVSGHEPGRWGPGAKMLGLEGAVSMADFKSLAKGLDPKTGQAITARKKVGRRAVLEVVASCPKSYSVAAVLGKDERLVALFERSVAETMVEASRYAAVRVRSGGRDEDAPAQNLVYAQFTHDVSRELDPDLHCHLPTFNMAKDEVSGQWRALQTSELFKRQRLFTALLNSKLAAGARNLGYEVEKTKNGFELAAIPQKIRDQFSKGSRKIDEAAQKLTNKEKGHAKVRSVMAWKTRPEKTTVNETTLHGRWQEEIGADYQLVKEAVAAARSRPPIVEKRLNVYEVVRESIERTTQHRAVVKDFEIEAAALDAANGQLGLTEVRIALDRAMGVIYTKPDRFGSKKLTTEKSLEAERRIVAKAKEGVGTEVPLLPSKNRKAVLSKIPPRHHKGMSLLLSSRDKVTVLTGDKETQDSAKKIAKAADIVVINSQNLSVTRLDNALTGQRRVLVLADSTKTASNALQLLLRHTGTTHARCTALAEPPAWKDNRGERLCWNLGDPDYYDVKIAGWWVWGQCAWIGSGWCLNTGPWSSNGVEFFHRAHSEDGGALPQIKRALPALSNNGMGINRRIPNAEITDRSQFIYNWCSALSKRLRDVRITCGDWKRTVTETVTTKHGVTAIFLDPPYGSDSVAKGLYSRESGVAKEVAAWCAENGGNPSLRIALCGYEGDYDLPGWTVENGRATNGGYGNAAGNENHRRERIWFSPHCVFTNTPISQN